jgi:hypothetical protein
MLPRFWIYMHLQLITMLAVVDSVGWSVCNHGNEMVCVLLWTVLSQVVENWRVGRLAILELVAICSHQPSHEGLSDVVWSLPSRSIAHVRWVTNLIGKDKILGWAYWLPGFPCPMNWNYEALPLLWSEPFASLHRPSCAEYQCNHRTTCILSWNLVDVWNHLKLQTESLPYWQTCKCKWFVLVPSCIRTSKSVPLMSLSEDSGTIKCKIAKPWDYDGGT